MDWKECCQLMSSHGCIILPNENGFCFRKVSTNLSPFEVSEQDYTTMDEALNAALILIKHPSISEFQVIIRFNRGLGPEYKNLSNITAENIQEANLTAEERAKKWAKEEKAEILEIKVRHIRL